VGGEGLVGFCADVCALLKRTFDSSTNLVITSSNHLLFALPSLKLSSAILNVSVRSTTDHLGPANNLNLWTACGDVSGSERIGTVSTRLESSGCGDEGGVVRWMMELYRRIWDVEGGVKGLRCSGLAKKKRWG
jgi:hypothetical protein